MKPKTFKEAKLAARSEYDFRFGDEIDHFNAGWLECARYLLGHEAVYNLEAELESAEAALAVVSVVTHGQYTPSAYNLKEIKSALLKFEQLKAEVENDPRKP